MQIIQKLQAQVREYRQINIFSISKNSREYRDLWADKSCNLIYIDTEFAYINRQAILLEICIHDALGQELVNTIINHNCTIESLYNESAKLGRTNQGSP